MAIKTKEKSALDACDKLQMRILMGRYGSKEIMDARSRKKASDLGCCTKAARAVLFHEHVAETFSYSFPDSKMVDLEDKAQLEAYER